MCPARQQVRLSWIIQQQKNRFTEMALLKCIRHCKLQYSIELICGLLPIIIDNSCLHELILALGVAVNCNMTHTIHAVDTVLKAKTTAEHVCSTLGKTVANVAVTSFRAHAGTHASAEAIAYWLQPKFVPSDDYWRMPMPSTHRVFIRRLIQERCTVLLFFLLQRVRCDPVMQHLPLNATASDAVFATMSSAHLAKLQQQANRDDILQLPLSSVACTRRTCVYNLILRAAKSSAIFSVQKTLDLMCARIARFGSHGFIQHCKHGCHCSKENSPLLYAHVLSLHRKGRTAAKMCNIRQQLYQMAAVHDAVPKGMVLHRKPFFNICNIATLAILDNTIREICDQTAITYSSPAIFEISNKLLHCIHRYDPCDATDKPQLHWAWQWMVENFSASDTWHMKAELNPEVNVPTMIVSACLHYAMTTPRSANNVWHDLGANNRLLYIFDTEFSAAAETEFFSRTNMQSAQRLAAAFFKACYKVDMHRHKLRTQLSVCFKGIKTIQTPFRKQCGLPAFAGFAAAKTPSWMYVRETKEAFWLYACMYRRLDNHQKILCDELLRLICNCL